VKDLTNDIAKLREILRGMELKTLNDRKLSPLVGEIVEAVANLDVACKKSG
jgi:hypothetical protein